MAALSLGFEEFERRLAAIRSRLNLYAGQDALYRAGSFVLGGVATVLLARPYTSPRTFSALLWGNLLVSITATVALALRLRRQWLSLDEVARLADREAALDSRLSTMLAQQGSPARSRLRGLLLSEVFLLASRWTPTRIAPRRVPRSLYPLCVALAAFAASLILAPEEPESTASDPGSRGAKQFAAIPDVDTAASPISPENAPTGQAAGAEGEAGTRAGDSEQSGAATGKAFDGTGPSAENGARAGKAQSLQARQDQPAGVPGARGASGESENGDSAAAGPQSQPDAHREPVQPSSDRQGTRQASRSPGEDKNDTRDSNADTGPDPKRSQRGANPERKGESAGSSISDAQKQKDAAGKREAGAGADRNGRDGAGRENALYGAEGKESTADPAASAMLIKLTAFSSSSAQDFEGQGEKGTIDGSLSGVAEAPSASQIAEQLNRETPLVRVPLTVEHESALRDIFTPRE